MNEDTETKRLGAYLFTLQRVVAALIATHPDPGRLVRVMERMNAATETEHLFSGDISDEVMQQAQAFADEMLDFAHLCANDPKAI